MSAPDTWMEDARQTSERIEGLLHRAAMQWSLNQIGPAKDTVTRALELMHEGEQIFERGMADKWRKGD